MWYVYKLQNFSLMGIYPLKAIAKKKINRGAWASVGQNVEWIYAEDLGLLKFSSTEHFYTWAALQKRY